MKQSGIRERELADRVRELMEKIHQEEKNRADTAHLYDCLSEALEEYKKIRANDLRYCGMCSGRGLTQ